MTILNLVLFAPWWTYIVYRTLKDYHCRKLALIQKQEDNQKIYQRGYEQGVLVTKSVNIRLDSIVFDHKGDLNATFLLAKTNKVNWER